MPDITEYYCFVILGNTIWAQNIKMEIKFMDGGAPFPS
jgi:hypothetical protein